MEFSNADLDKEGRSKGNSDPKRMGELNFMPP